MRPKCLRLFLLATLLTVGIFSLLIFGLITNSGFLGFSFIQIISVLFIAIILDVPQTLGRSLLLLFVEAFRSGYGKNVRVMAYPKVSIIVPARNEEPYIGNTLASLLEDTYPDKEIIVVDDGSSDKTYIKALMFTEDSRVKVLRRKEPSGAKARAVNYGLLYATGEIVIVVDGDTIVEREAVNRLIAPMINNPETIAAAGNIRVVNRINLLTRLQAYEYFISMEMGRRWQAMLSGLLVIPGAFGAVRRSVLESLGRMHADTITEDFDLTVMLQKVKKKIAFSPEAIAWTYVPENLREWTRQRIRWASGQAQVYLKHSNMLLKRRFGIFGLLIAPNNIFMDMVALFIRYAWLAIILIIYITSILTTIKLLLLITSFYLALEYIQLISATLLMPGKETITNMVLAPLMIPYRTIHAAIRLSAYIRVLFRRRSRW
ncbi:MAG: glycosyltransferase [Candidatus Bathyarchaeia archaeon]